MRKMSQDGGDNTSITSGIENEIKKSGPGILKSTKNSFKRKLQNLSTESDDTANEPLLHKSKEKSEIEKQSAKLLLSKTKTDFASSKDNDKDKLLADDKIAKPSITDITGITDASTCNGLKYLRQDVSQSLSTTAIHNHMNTKVLNSPGILKNTVVTKTQILVEVDTSKPSGYAPSPLIFTTAKIHTDGKMHQMEPVQVTPVPILSTIEGGVVKTEIKVKAFEKHKDTALKSPGSCISSYITSNENIPNGSMKRFGNKHNDNKVKVSSPLFGTAAQQLDTSKITSVESTRIKNGEPSITSQENKEAKIEGEPPINKHELQQAKPNISNSTQIDITVGPTHTSSTFDKIYTDINKNVQSELKTDGGQKYEDINVDSGVVSSQPLCSSSNNIRLNLDSASKEDNTTTNVDTNIREYKSGNSQENEIATSKVKSPDREQVLNITKTVSTVKPTIDPVSDSKKYTQNSLESCISGVNTSLPDKSMPNTSRAGIFKPVKEQASNKANNDIIATSLSSNNEVDSAISPKNSNVKADFSAKSLPSTTKSSEIQSLTTSSHTKTSMQCKTTGIKTSPQSKLFDSKTLSNESSVPNASSLPTAVTSASIAPQINKVPTTIITTTNNKNSAKVMTTTTSSAMISSKLPSSISSSLITTADVSKLKSKNVATVVSSISKATTTPSSTKTKITPSSSSSIPTKSTSTLKQLTSPSTVKTIFSVPTVKSAVVGTLHHDKVSTKGVSIPVKAISTVSNSASSTSKKPLTAKSSSTVTVNPSAKVVATTSTKPATKCSTQSDLKPNEDKKDNKGSKA